MGFESRCEGRPIRNAQGRVRTPAGNFAGFEGRQDGPGVALRLLDVRLVEWVDAEDRAAQRRGHFPAHEFGA